MPKRRQYTTGGETVTDLILTIFRVNGRLLRVGDTLTRDVGLTSARWQIMGAIADHPRTAAQIARNFGTTRQGVLWVVTGLVKDGLVELADNPDHKRAKLVQLTAKGHKVNDEVQRRQTIWANKIASGFKTEDIRAALNFIERLSHGRRLEEAIPRRGA